MTEQTTRSYVVSCAIEMSYEHGQPTVWVDLFGQTIPPEKVEDIPFKYYLPPERDQALLGNYWWVVRIRPQSRTKKYEYMMNKSYFYSRLAWNFAQVKSEDPYAIRQLLVL
jgi:hypothetical protein